MSSQGTISTLAANWDIGEGTSWEEGLRVLIDCDAGELSLSGLVEVELLVCEDEHCESCDTVYAWSGPGKH